MCGRIARPCSVRPAIQAHFRVLAGRSSGGAEAPGCGMGRPQGGCSRRSGGCCLACLMPLKRLSIRGIPRQSGGGGGQLSDGYFVSTQRKNSFGHSGTGLRRIIMKIIQRVRELQQVCSRPAWAEKQTLRIIPPDCAYRREDLAAEAGRLSSETGQECRTQSERAKPYPEISDPDCANR